MYESGWREIESAPKDGTPVLLFARHIYAESSTRVVGAYLLDHGWLAQSYAGQGSARLDPSHWMALPPFPDCSPPAPTSHPIPTGATGGDAEQVRHKMNADLCAFYMRWEADGDYLRCRKCKRPQIASYAEKGFPHAAGCKAVGNVEQRPWLALVELMRPLIGSVAPAAGDALPSFDIEAAAQKMAECMDYPWAHMPEQGRTHMRKSAQAVIDAARAAIA